MTDDRSTNSTLEEAVPAVLKALIVVAFPWLVLVVDRYSIRGKLGGIRRWNLLWAPTVYYLAAGSIVAVVLAPTLSLRGLLGVSQAALLEATATFPLFVLGVLIAGVGNAISLMDIALIVAVGIIATGLGYAFSGIGTAAYFRRLATEDGGQIILPVSKVRQHDGIHTKNVRLSRSKSILVLGESGSGKTESMRLMVNQMQSEPDEPFVVFDYKDEFREDIFADDEYIHLSLRDSDVEWNLFREAEEERDLREFGRMLFPENEASDNAFFEKGARQIFVAVTRVMYREFDDPDNAHIQELFRKHTFRTLGDIFEGHPDLVGNVQEYLDEENPRTSQSVFAFVTQTIEDVFIDDFAAESGSFSIREYMADPDGKKLILDIPQQNTQSVAPAFRFFIDQAIKHSLQDGSRNAYFLLDEFARVPSLDQIENLTGAGRAMGSQAILGLQSISQLRRHYDEDYANDILAGVTQEVLMRPSDQRTVDYVQRRTGEQEYTTRREKPKKFYESDTFGNVQESYDTRFLIQTSELQRFDDGEAILMTTDGWQRAQLPMWHQLSKAARLGLSGREYNPVGQLRSLVPDRTTDTREDSSTSDRPTGTTSDSESHDTRSAPASQASTAGSGSTSGTESSASEAARSTQSGATSSATVGSTTFCPFCGEDLHAVETNKFCPACGEELPAQNAD